ncbi:MAG: LLM class F420-dependent oxidoreductase [Actinomycetota bacterium]|nr:LLM class F420-dependent oxidoreductase [Actinomycetota bacterium]
MKLGIGIFPTDRSISPVELAVAAEDAGFESFWVPEHTHIPLGETSFPGGAEVAEMYKRSLDPFVALGAVAAATTSIRIGTGICLVIERDPIVTAKEVATLDLLSQGRVLFGIGAGWNRMEMANHGTEPSTRFALMEERVEVLRTIWREDEPAFHGRFHHFDPIYCWPKPVQAGGPPVLIGGNGARVLERVVAYGDEWMPNATSPATLAVRIAELQTLASEAGRAGIPVTVFGSRPDAAALAAFEQAGAHRVTLWVPSEGREVVLPLVEQYAGLLSG